MKKKTLILIALLATLAVVGGVIWYLLNTTTDPDLDDTITVLTNTVEDIASVHVVNEKGDYYVETDDSDIGYHCETIDGLPQLKSSYISLLEAVAGIQATSEYPHSDLTRYGFDDPMAVVDVSLNDGTSYTVSIGSKAPSENYIYFTVSDAPDTVYTARMSKFLPLLTDAYGLVNKLLAPKTESPRAGNDETDTADWLEYTTSDGTRFRLEQLFPAYVDGAGNSYRFHQTAPVDGYVQASKAMETFSRVMQFCASSVRFYHPSEEQIAECGLLEPETELVLAYRDDVAVIHLSKAPNGDYYAIKDGVDVIWNIADYMVTWLDVQPRTMISSYLLAPPMSEVASLEIDAFGDHFSFDIADGVVTSQGVEMNTSDFKRFYELACSVNSQNVSEETPGETVVSIRFTLDDGTVRTAELSELGNRVLKIAVDGQDMGLTIREAYAETLHDAAGAVIDKQSFSTNW